MYEQLKGPHFLHRFISTSAFLPGFGKELPPVWSTCALSHALPFFKRKNLLSQLPPWKQELCGVGNAPGSMGSVQTWKSAFLDRRVLKPQAGIPEPSQVSSGLFGTTSEVPVGQISHLATSVRAYC